VDLIDFLLQEIMEEFKVKENRFLLRGDFFSKLPEEETTRTKILKLTISSSSKG
jgi:hypothetical protein